MVPEIWTIHDFYPTPFKRCAVIIFTNGVPLGGQAGRQAAGKNLSGLYLGDLKVWEVDTW